MYKRAEPSQSQRATIELKTREREIAIDPSWSLFYGNMTDISTGKKG